jgi:hypothetical protein
MNEQDEPHPADKSIGADWRPPRHAQMQSRRPLGSPALGSALQDDVREDDEREDREREHHEQGNQHERVRGPHQQARSSVWQALALPQTNLEMPQGG